MGTSLKQTPVACRVGPCYVQVRTHTCITGHNELWEGWGEGEMSAKRGGGGWVGALESLLLGPQSYLLHYFTPPNSAQGIQKKNSQKFHVLGV